MPKDEFGVNKENLAVDGQDAYVETLVVYGKMVNVFINDYGQCYWFQWVDDNGKLRSETCGTYVTEYKEEIEDFFKPEIERIWDTLQDLRLKYRDVCREIAVLKDDKNEDNNGDL